MKRSLTIIIMAILLSGCERQTVAEHSSAVIEMSDEELPGVWQRDRDEDGTDIPSAGRNRPSDMTSKGGEGSDKSGGSGYKAPSDDGPLLEVYDMPEEEEEAVTEEQAMEDFHGYILSEEEQSDPRVKCVETADEGRVVMDFAGDINFDDRYSIMSTYRSKGAGMAGVLGGSLIRELNSADIFAINNEFPYSDRGTPTPDKTYTFRAKPSMVKNLTEMGTDIVTLANNHAYDHGEEALLDTFDTLAGAHIPYVGAGRNLQEAMKPFYFIAGGMKIGYVAATQIERTSPPDTKEATEGSAGVLRTLDPEKFLSVIRESEANADITVVFVHWGSENKYQIDDSQRQLAKSYAAAGADLIVGAHSHCLQGFEYVDGVPVLYSLGNFWFSSKDRDSGVLQAVASQGRIESVRFLPCIQHNCRTDMYEKGDGEYDRLLGVMAGLSYNVSIDDDGYVTDGAGRGVAPRDPKPL